MKEGVITKENFEELYDTYSQKLFLLIYINVKNEEISQKLLIDCFVQIWYDLDQYDPSKESKELWMGKRAKKFALDFLVESGKKLHQTLEPECPGAGENFFQAVFRSELLINPYFSKLLHILP